MKFGVVIPETRIETAQRFAARVEDLGYDSLWKGELWGTDAPVTLGAAAGGTSSIRIGTAIVSPYARTPATAAMIAATLHRLTDGRAILGLGPSTPTAVRTIHGRSFDRPLECLGEYVDIVRRLLAASDDPVTVAGDFFEVEGLPTLDAPVPLYNAALGPANRRLTGRKFDGWLPHNIPLSHLETAFEPIAVGAREAGRDPDAITVSLHLPAAVGETLEAARGLIRGHVAYYVGTGPGYRRAVAMAYPERAERIADAWSGGDRDRARSLVTDEMIRDLGVAATPGSAGSERARIEGLDVVDECRLVLPAGADSATVDRTIERFSPAADQGLST